MAYMFLMLFATFFSTGLFASDTTYKGKNWTESFKESCGMPSYDIERPSVSWDDPSKKNEIIFSLRPKDVGKCTSDTRPRHSAEYWERAEIKQEKVMTENTNYEIKFEVNFLKGFKADRETFFQIHSYSVDCPSSPILMLKFNNEKLIASVLENVTKERPSGNHWNRFKGDVNLNQLTGYNSFRIIFNQRQNLISIDLNGKNLVMNQKYERQDCGKPYAKIGIYRPGNESGKESQASFKNVTITKL